MVTATEKQLLEEINSVSKWRQTIEVAPGVFTPGSVNTKQKLTNVQLPDDFSGKRVLEIGAAEGFFSFLAEQRGAEAVVAVDNRAPHGFSICKRLLQSEVTYIQSNLYELPLTSLGKFDSVICVDVLYHLDEPFRALQIMRELCAGEIHLTTIRHDSDQPSMKFIERSYPNGHNRWAISPSCLQQMLEFVGFADIETWPYGDRLGAYAKVG